MREGESERGGDGVIQTDRQAGKQRGSGKRRRKVGTKWREGGWEGG